jgi:hypothetical protein
LSQEPQTVMVLTALYSNDPLSKLCVTCVPRK